MAREYPRKLRVATELQRALNELLQFEVKDPRLHGVTISSIDVSGDLSHAKAFFSSLQPDADPAPIESAFAAAAGYLRSQLGSMTKLRRVPELHFLRDDSVRQGIELTHLIETTVDRDNETHVDDESDPATQHESE